MNALLLVLIGWTNPDSGWPGSSPDVPDPPICAQSGLHNECGSRPSAFLADTGVALEAEQ
jgi:hypothetical protein